MLKALIIDRDPNIIARIISCLNESMYDVDIIGSYAGIYDAIGCTESNVLDVVFLEVDKPSINRYSYVKSLRDRDVKVVYLSHTKEYAHDAIKAEVSDYLLKPIKVELLNDAIEKVKVASSCHCRKDIKIKFPNAKGIRYINASEILYIKSDGNYTWIFNTDSERFHCSYNLKKIDELLGQRPFMRVHNQYVVNLSKVAEYKSYKNGSIVLSNGFSVPLARKKRDKVLDILDTI